MVKVLDAVLPFMAIQINWHWFGWSQYYDRRIRGVATLLENKIQFPVHRTWCMRHQIDLIAKSSLSALLRGDFMTVINKIAVSLRK
jgi:hypothetical protein